MDGWKPDVENIPNGYQIKLPPIERNELYALLGIKHCAIRLRYDRDDEHFFIRELCPTSDKFYGNYDNITQYEYKKEGSNWTRMWPSDYKNMYGIAPNVLEKGSPEETAFEALSQLPTPQEDPDTILMEVMLGQRPMEDYLAARKKS